MFKKLKMKIAARRVQKKSAHKSSRKSANIGFWRRAWDVICTPFRIIWGWLCRAWAWVKSINIIGLVNTTLLCAIIVLFSMLIIDIVNCRRAPVVIVANSATHTVKPVKVETVPDTAKVEKVALPVRRDRETRKFTAAPVQVVPVKKCTITERQTARIANTLHGDVILDSRGAAKILKSGDKINGNLYLQNMNKYTLPCDIKVEGNMILRNMGMLQFCGDFTVTGNIYVSPRSSFGPIPATARIGGQVIL